MSTNVVVDTSVFISALISNSGTSRAILRQCFEGIYQPLMGNALFYEYTGVMHRPEILSQCPLSLDECQAFLNSFISTCKWTQIYYLWRPNLKDEGDNHLIELALYSNQVENAKFSRWGSRSNLGQRREMRA